MKEGIDIIQELGDKQAKVDVYWRYGSMTSFYKRWDEAYKIMEEGLQIAQEYKDPWMEVRYKNNIAWLAIAQTKPELVEADIEHNLEEAIRLGNNYDIADASHIYADVTFLKGNYQLAEKRYKEAAKNALQLGSGLQVGVLLHSMALSVAGQGKHEKGLRLFGASKAKLEELGAEIPAVDTVTTRIDQTVGKSIQILGAQKSQSLELEGRQMGFEKAIEYAFDIDKD
jgi:tetratricopeptide (TPR) repeat protein